MIEWHDTCKELIAEPDTSWILNECYLFTATILVIILTLPKMSHGMF